MATVVINNATLFGTPEECAAFVREMSAPPKAGVVSGSGTVETPELREGLRVRWRIEEEGPGAGSFVGTVTEVGKRTFQVRWDDGGVVSGRSFATVYPLLSFGSSLVPLSWAD